MHAKYLFIIEIGLFIGQFDQNNYLVYRSILENSDMLAEW